MKSILTEYIGTLHFRCTQSCEAWFIYALNRIQLVTWVYVHATYTINILMNISNLSLVFIQMCLILSFQVLFLSNTIFTVQQYKKWSWFFSRHCQNSTLFLLWLHAFCWEWFSINSALTTLINSCEYCKMTKLWFYYKCTNYVNMKNKLVQNNWIIMFLNLITK